MKSNSSIMSVCRCTGDCVHQVPVSGSQIRARDGWDSRRPEILEVPRQSLWKPTKKQFKSITFGVGE